MSKIYLEEKEIEKYPIYYKGKTNEALVREFSPTELLKIFHFYSQNKIDTLKFIEEYRKDLSFVSELLLFKKYVCDKKDSIKGILIDKGYETNLRTLLQGGISPFF